jgi:hypothetical protein
MVSCWRLSWGGKTSSRTGCTHRKKSRGQQHSQRVASLISSRWLHDCMHTGMSQWRTPRCPSTTIVLQACQHQHYLPDGRYTCALTSYCSCLQHGYIGQQTRPHPWLHVLQYLLQTCSQYGCPLNRSLYGGWQPSPEPQEGEEELLPHLKHVRSQSKEQADVHTLP